MSLQAQLFTISGNLDATVSIPWEADIILWGHKYYALREGRYVESKCVAGFVEQPKSAASLVGFNIRRR